ncbi:MAG: hypothetical protein Q9199_002924 [Rusavskia elegans]
MVSPEILNQSFKAHLRCLGFLVGAYLAYTEAELTVPESILATIRTECQTLLDTSKDQEIVDLEDARDDLDDLKDLADGLGRCQQDNTSESSERQILHQLIAQKETRVKAHEELYGPAERTRGRRRSSSSDSLAESHGSD